MPKLADKIAIVTGGGRAMGQVIARRLAADGCHVVVAGPVLAELQESARQIEGLGRRCLPVLTDIRREDQVSAMAKAARDAFGRIDILVNNAGIVGPTAPVADVPLADWEDVLAVNLTGAFLCAKAVLPVMIAQRSGKIINISSVVGKMAYALRSPYAVSKWGVIGLSHTLAKEYGEHNIQVNAICPGPVRGERMRGIIEKRAQELGQSLEEVERFYTSTTLLKRFVEPENVAAMVAFLASPEGDNITGQAIDVSAGYGV